MRGYQMARKDKVVNVQVSYLESVCYENISVYFALNISTTNWDICMFPKILLHAFNILTSNEISKLSQILNQIQF